MKNLCTAALFFILSGHGLNAQQNLSKMRVSYNADKMPAPDAIERFIAENKIKQYSYSKKSMNGYYVQSTKCTNEKVLECLTKLLEGMPFEAIIDNDMVIIRKNKNSSAVFSTEDIPVPLAKSDTTKNSSVNKIDEIVVNAGYYKVKEKERTGSIAKVTAKDIENQPVTNVLSTMQGRMAGVSITQNSGVPGGGFDVQIRGRNSLRTLANSEIDGNMPLYVIDGVPIGGLNSKNSNTIFAYGSMNPLNTINSNDIESIEVLKDADATAIYGSRGANGVILITTKKGKTGKLSLSLNSVFGLSQMVSKLKMMNTQQYLAMRKQAYVNDGITTYPANTYDINGTWDQNRFTDWRKILIGNTATSTNTQLTLSGGSELTTFLISLAHNEESTVYGQDFRYKGYNISANINHQSADKRFNISVSNMFSVRNNNVPSSDMSTQAYLLSPNAPALYSADGGLNWENNTFNNPLAAYNGTYSNDSKQLISNLNLSYKITKDLALKLNGGLNYQNFEDIVLEPNTMYNPSTVQGSSSLNSVATKTNQERFSLITEPELTWTKKWNKHKFDFLLGGTIQHDINKQGRIQGVGFESNTLINNIGAAKTKIISDQIESEYRYVAVFGRLNYQFLDRYILNLTGRRDGSSRFGPNKRFANFGALGAAWIFSREAFLASSKWLSFGKLRASYGSAGSDNIGDFQYLNNYTVSATDYDGTTALFPARLFNPDYSWEITKKLEAAVELGFLKNRINLNASWYKNRSSNQLVGYQLPELTGFPSVMANLNATVQNSGIELELNAVPFNNPNFKWQTSFNISFPKNKLIAFPGLEGSPYSSQYVIGQPTSIVKVYQLEGINPQTGQYIFTDFNGDGKITDPDDRQLIENLAVNYFGGISNTIQYKNWDLSFLFQFVKTKGRNYNYILPVPGRMSNLPIEVLDVWSPQNPAGTYMPYTSKTSTMHRIFTNSNATISDASFVRLKNIQLAYRIPLRASIFKEVKVFFSAQNLFTWTKYFGVDPETPGIGSLPPLRTFAFGLQCNL